MNKEQAATVLALAGAFDRWIRVDDVTATAWEYALADVPFEFARESVIEHYKGPDAHKALMPADVIRRVEVKARRTRWQVEADVRTAKAYGLVEKDWPDRQVLSEEVRQRLEELREGVRREALEQGHITQQEFRDMEKRVGGAAA